MGGSHIGVIGPYVHLRSMQWPRRDDPGSNCPRIARGALRCWPTYAARMTWHPRQLAQQTGCTFVVTGANSGIGLEAARQLVGRGAHVVLAVRDTAKGEKAAAGLE